jgi:transcriptional regulator with XRE-family HTH domain
MAAHRRPQTRITQTIGKRVKLLRDEIGLTQSQLADKCNRSEIMIRKIESGFSLSVDSLVALASHLGTTTDYLVGLDENSEI